MKILEIGHAFPPTRGGVETHLWDISQGLAQRGHVVTVLAGGRERREALSGVTIVRKPALGPSELVKRRGATSYGDVDLTLLDGLHRLFARSIQEFAPDIIHAHNAHEFAPELSIALIDCARNIPSVNTVHDRNTRYSFRETLDFDWAHVLYPSAFIERSLPCSRPSTVRHLGVDLGHFSRTGDLLPQMTALERPIVFHPARLLAAKGHVVALRAFAEFRKIHGTGTFVLCVSQDIVDVDSEAARVYGDVTALAATLGIFSHVKTVDVARDLMPQAYRASDVVWYPTVDDEPLGLVCLEAMACGVPVVVSNSGGMIELVTNDENGIVVPKGDAGALTRATLDVMNDASLRDKLVAAGLTKAAACSSDAYVAALEELYRATVAKGAVRTATTPSKWSDRVALGEFRALRQEIDNRTLISNQLIAVEVAAVAGGLAAADKIQHFIPLVAAAFSIVTAFLWLMWLDQSVAVTKIAAYIYLRLGETLRRRSRSALEWEKFIRQLDLRGSDAHFALDGIWVLDRLRLPRTSDIGVYTGIFFGLSSLASLVAGVACIPFSGHAAPSLDTLIGMLDRQHISLLNVPGVVFAELRLIATADSSRKIVQALEAVACTFAFCIFGLVVYKYRQTRALNREIGNRILARRRI